MSAQDIIARLRKASPGLYTGTQEYLTDRLELVIHKLKFLESRPAIALITALQPLSFSGGLLDEMVDMAGGSSIDHLISRAEIQPANPEILILMLLGLTPQAALGEVPALLQISGFSELKAVQNNRLCLINGSLDYRHSPSDLVELTEILAEIINPKQFAFGYEGDGWMKFSF